MPRGETPLRKVDHTAILFSSFMTSNLPVRGALGEVKFTRN